MFEAAAKNQAQILPELNFPLSGETNALGGAAVSFVSKNPLAAITNPALLGLSSLKPIFSTSFSPQTPTSTTFPYYSDGSLSALGVNLGYPLNNVWDINALRVGVGVGYSSLNYSFLPLNTLGPEPINRESDVVSGITAGIGLDYLVKFGLGYKYKWVSIKDASFPAHSLTSEDFGALLDVPVDRVISNLEHIPALISGDLQPELNVTCGYAERNTSNDYVFGSVLPKQSALGLDLEVGLKTEVANHLWRLISLRILRQANANMVSEDSSLAVNQEGDTSITFRDSYRRGFGNFLFSRNLIVGRPGGVVGISKGWQIGLGQLIYLRDGSVTNPGYPTYTTFGWGASTKGLIRLLVFVHWLYPSQSLTQFLLTHFDLEFDYSKATGGPFAQVPFESLSVILW